MLNSARGLISRLGNRYSADSRRDCVWFIHANTDLGAGNTTTSNMQGFR